MRLIFDHLRPVVATTKRVPAPQGNVTRDSRSINRAYSVLVLGTVLKPLGSPSVFRACQLVASGVPPAGTAATAAGFRAFGGSKGKRSAESSTFASSSVAHDVET